MSKKILVKIFIALLLLCLPVAGIYSLPYILDMEGHKQNFIKSMKVSAGMDVEIRGDISLEMMPYPKVTLGNVAIKNTKDGYANNFATMDSIEITSGFMDFLFGEINIEDLKIKNAVVRFENFSNSRPNWLFKGQDGAEQNAAFNIQKFSFENLKLILRTGTKYDVVQRMVSLKSGDIIPESTNGPFVSNGVFASKDNRVAIFYNAKFGDITKSSSDFSFSLISDSSNMKIVGKMDNKEGDYSLSGKMTSHLDSSLRSVGAVFAGVDNIFSDVIANSFSSKGANVTGDFSLSGDGIFLKNVALTSGDVVAKGSFGVAFADVPKVNAEFNVNTVNLDSLLDGKGLLEEMQSSFGGVSEIDRLFMQKVMEEEAAKKRFKFSFPRDLDYFMNISIDNFIYKESNVKDISIKIEKDRGNIKIYHIKISNIPGNMEINWQGDAAAIDAPDAEKKPDKITIKSANILEFLKWANFDTSSLRKEEFSKFNANARILFGEENVLLSGVKIAFGDIKIAAKGFFNKDRDISGDLAIRINNINLDKSLLPKEKDEDDLEDEIIAFDILRNIDIYFDKLALSLNVGEIISNGKSLTELKSVANFSPGKLKVKKLSFNTNIGKFLTRFDLDTSQLRPYLEADIKFDYFDTDFYTTLFGIKPSGKHEKFKRKNTSHPRWSTKLFSFDKLGILTGKVNLYVNKFTYEDLVFERIKASLDVGSDKIEIKEFRGDIFGSKLEISGYIGTKRPSINITFSTNGIDIRKVLHKFIGYRGIIGKGSISGNISMIGFTFRQWINSMRGSANIIIRNAIVKGFDLVSLSKKIPKAANVKEAQYWSKKSLSSGQTQIDYVNANIVLDQGFAELKNTQISHLLFRNGRFSGKFNLAKWKAGFSAIFPTVSSRVARGDIPASLTASGDIGDIKIKWDHKAIENFWEANFYVSRF